MEVYYNWRIEQQPVEVPVPNKIARKITMLRKQLIERKKKKEG